MTTLGIVTPYYQTSPSVLRRTAESVAAQTAACDPPKMIWTITDDGSPVPASAELADFQAPRWLDVHIERTANRGISAARNRSLDALRGNCDYIAFLDSDDTWAAVHGERAVMALGNDYDFYFSNYMKMGKTASTFELFEFRPERFPEGVDGLFFPGSDGVFDAIVKRNPVWTTTVVVREALVGAIRFQQKLRRAGEDHVFWMECCRNTNRIVASSLCEAFAGDGVNVFAGAKRWGAPGTSRRAAAGLRYVDHVLHRYSLTADQREHLEKRASVLRDEVAANTLHGLRRGRWREILALGVAIRSDKRMAQALVRRLVK